MRACVGRCGWHYRRRCRPWLRFSAVDKGVRSVDAVVVGAGPNGLTAAARLAREGWSVRVYEATATIGGGSRTKPLTGDSVFDVCAAVHPFGVSSPAFEELRLEEHGLEWLFSPIGLAHPFDDGTAAALYRDVDETCAGLGADAGRWRTVVGGLAADWDRLRHLVLGSVISGSIHHPLRMGKFGTLAGLPASAVVRLFHTREARALLGGFAAHAGTSL